MLIELLLKKTEMKMLQEIESRLDFCDHNILIEKEIFKWNASASAVKRRQTEQMLPIFCFFHISFSVYP
jgi:hypothetical protein